MRHGMPFADDVLVSQQKKMCDKLDNVCHNAFIRMRQKISFRAASFTKIFSPFHSISLDLAIAPDQHTNGDMLLIVAE